MSTSVRIRIGGDELDLAEIDRAWVHDRFHRGHHGNAPCVVISINSGDVRLLLARPGCATGGGGGPRPLTPREEEVIRRWRQLHLDEPDHTDGNLWAFLAQLDRLI